MADLKKTQYIAVIQAGGKGTRLRELTKGFIPKPMLELNGKPMIQWQIENIARYGIREFVIIIGYLGEKIREYFGDGRQFGVKIEYIKEDETYPLGSAGALYYLKPLLKERNIFLVYGDVMFDIDLSRMLSFHEANGGMGTLLVHPNSHPHDSDLVILNKDGKVIGFDSKGHGRDYWHDNLVNAGIYVLDSVLIDELDKPEQIDLEKDILRPLIDSGDIYGYRTPEYVKDAGTAERFRSVELAQMKGLWNAKNLEHKQRCIFLDRDGTVNVYHGLIDCVEDLELEKCAAEAIRTINQSGYLAIVVTNQPVVARGLCTIEEIEDIHRKLSVLLGRQGAFLDDIVYCPHHPDKGYPDENPEYKIICTCRKPATGMIDQMVEKYNIDRSRSFMIGDMSMDIQIGKNSGLKTVLVHTGVGGTDGKYDISPDMEAADLLEAVKNIMKLEE